MRTSDRGVAHIKASEGLSLRAYPDPGTGGEPFTIGYGHTGDVEPGDSITPEAAERMLRKDLEWAERCVDMRVTVPITQGQFDALVSFVFNVGCAAFDSSTLLKKLNAADYAGAQAEFSRWIYAAGRVLPGLVSRRKAEIAMFGDEQGGAHWYDEVDKRL